MAWRGEAIVPRAGNQSQGYYAGYGPQAGGSGSGMGQANVGAGELAPGTSVNIAGSSWHPTILYLFALIIAEMVIFGLVGRLMR